VRQVFYRLLADIVFVFHLGVVFMISFGWVYASLFYVYGAILFVTLYSWIFVGHCFLTDLEFSLRLKGGSTITQSSGFLSYYGQLVFKDKAPRDIVIYYTGMMYLLITSFVWLYKFLIL
jgi:hypothetical protein